MDSLAEVYRAKTDEELRILASDSDSLVEEARGVLANEIRLRNLTSQPFVLDTAEVVPDSSSSKTNFASSVITLGLLVLVATFLFKVFQLPFEVSLPGTIIVFFIQIIISARRKKNRS
jgi:hypothetical protein